MSRRRGIAVIVVLLVVAVGAATASIVLALRGTDPARATSAARPARLDIRTWRRPTSRPPGPASRP